MFQLNKHLLNTYKAQDILLRVVEYTVKNIRNKSVFFSKLVQNVIIRL